MAFAPIAWQELAPKRWNRRKDQPHPGGPLPGLPSLRLPVYARPSFMILVPAHEPEHLETVRALFREYADSLDIDLCFQNFAKELAELPGIYAPPAGRLLLAWEQDTAAGCVALRPAGKGVCEMKRLFVRPGFRGRRIGRVLAEAIIAAAQEIGYGFMRLDTLVSMQAARSLYQSLGFYPIAPYHENPERSAIFLELKLKGRMRRLTL